MNTILQNLDFYVTPVLNIDGYVYTWQNESVSSTFRMTCYVACALSPSNRLNDAWAVTEDSLNLYTESPVEEVKIPSP